MFGPNRGTVTLKRIGFFCFPIKHSTHTLISQHLSTFIRVGNLTPLECLVEAVDLRKDEFAVVVVLGACGLRLRVCACIAAALPPAPSNDANPQVANWTLVGEIYFP